MSGTTTPSDRRTSEEPGSRWAVGRLGAARRQLVDREPAWWPAATLMADVAVVRVAFGHGVA